MEVLALYSKMVIKTPPSGSKVSPISINAIDDLGIKQAGSLCLSYLYKLYIGTSFLFLERPNEILQKEKGLTAPCLSGGFNSHK